MGDFVKIALDAMGGDNAPQEIVKGAVESIKKCDVKVFLVGKKDLVESELKKYVYDKNKIEVVHAEEVISNEDQPTLAIRNKKKSSMVVGMQLVKEKKVQAFISGGNTGALLTGGLFIVGRIQGVDRPVLAPLIPTKKGVFLLVDGGSNVDCKPINLLQFAQMGSIYMKNVLNVNDPKVGLLNIGVENEKGNKLTKEAFPMMKESNINFIGNIEAREVPNGVCDVLVCDGFIGNILLKYTEGFAVTLFSIIKEELLKGKLSKIGALLLKPAFKKIKSRFDYEEHGGAPLLGINGVVIKIHGSSNATSVVYAIEKAKEFVEKEVVEKISYSIPKE